MMSEIIWNASHTNDDERARLIADLQAKLAAYEPVVQAAIAVNGARLSHLRAVVAEDKRADARALRDLLGAHRKLDLAVFVLQNPHVAAKVADLMRQAISEDLGKGEESDE